MGFTKGNLPVRKETVRRIKTNRQLLKEVVEMIGRPVYGANSRVSGNSCHCPFHHDSRPSASIHAGLGGGCDWLFTCHRCDWNDLNPKRRCSSGDVIAVVRVAAKRSGHELTFQDACRWFLTGPVRLLGQRFGSLIPPPILAASAGPDPAELSRTRAEMPVAQARLLDNPELMTRLWRKRAVARGTAARFAVGFSPGEPGGDYWCFPIVDAQGNLVVVKFHADGDARPKGLWYPPNGKRGELLYPIELAPTGPVWLAPGEFKGLALIDVGLPAIGTTAGEHVLRLPPEAIRLLRGRSVAIAPDNDVVGRAWAAAVGRQLLVADIDVRIVDLGIKSDGGDVGDWLVERRVNEGQCAEAVRAGLLAAHKQALRLR